MRLGLATLGVGATVFFVRVLIAFVFDGVSSVVPAERLYFARFAPARRRGGLIAIKPGDQAQEFRTGTYSKAG